MVGVIAILASLLVFMEETASNGWQDVIWTIAGAAVTALAGTGVGLLVSWLKNLKIIKKLGIENLIDKAAEIAVHAAEAWGRKASLKGAEKLNKAKEAFEAELAKQGIKLDAGQIEARLESIFNKLKETIEKKPAGPVSSLSL